MQALIEGSSSTATFDPASTFIFTISAFAVITVIFFNGEYRRSALEHAHAANSRDTSESQSTTVANTVAYQTRSPINGVADSDVSPVDTLNAKLIDNNQLSSSSNR